MKYLRARVYIMLIIGSCATLATGTGLEWQVSGYLGAEVRWFVDEPLDPRQNSGLEASVSFEPEIYGESPDGKWAVMAKPFVRADSADSERTHFDIRELYAHWRGGDWEVKAGLSKVFWGVTESRHLVDIINQTDLVENFDGEDKLGQPMVQVTRLLPQGTLDLFILPGFRERTFPGEEGRLRPSYLIDTDYPLFESGSEEWHTDVALRLKAYAGPFDIGLSYFYGTSRDPLFVPMVRETEVVLLPQYNLIHQAGLDLQYTTGPWLWKLEAIARSGKGHHHRAVTGGFEYTFYGVFDSAWDVGALLEYHYDSRGEGSPDPFNNDLFAAVRIAPNDEFDTAFLLGGLRDLENGASAIRAEVERRMLGDYKLVLEAQYYVESDPLDPAYPLRNDSYFTLGVKRYF